MSEFPRKSEPASAEVDAALETFSFMAIEEFFKKKNMPQTLAAMRTEWNRPGEVRNIHLYLKLSIYLIYFGCSISLKEEVMISWYDVALKLRLPELLTDSPKHLSIVENLIKALVREASLKTRRTEQNTLSGLHRNNPHATSLPVLVQESPITTYATNIDEETPAAPEHSRRPSSAGHKSSQKKIGNHPSVKRHFDPSDKFQSRVNTKGISSENWVPEDLRFKSLQRELAVAQVTLGDIVKREKETSKEMKRLSVTPLERARVEESLGATRKIPCGCCTKPFLYVNLPLKVSLKAILDIRIKWSGNLSSANVFGALTSDGDDTDDDQSLGSTALGSTLGMTKKGKAGKEKTKSKDLLSKCYDQVSVCVFCAQFFHVQEDYRPSFQTITLQEKKAAYFETKRRELEYWDPLKMCEKDREEAELRQKLELEAGMSTEHSLVDQK